jgi:hypothetical protein
VPTALSSYPTTTIPADDARCRNHSMWHCDSDATNSSSGLNRSRSPRNDGSDEPSSGGFVPMRTSWSRLYAV